MQGSSFRYLFHVLLGITYIAMGVFIFSNRAMAMSPWAEILSLLFVIYGIWRVSRSIGQLRKYST